MSTIVMDVFEPDHMYAYLSQMMQVVRFNLVQQNLCDYMWFAIDGHQITLERKTWQDLIHSRDRIEAQLRRATQHTQEVGLIVEGLAEPTADGNTRLYDLRLSKKGDRYFRESKISKYRYDALESFLWRLDKEGISVYNSASMESTAWQLKTFVEASQDMKNTTLKHYIRTKAINWKADPRVRTAMSIYDEHGAVLGEIKAKELIKRFGSVWEAIHKTPQEIEMECIGIGVPLATRLIKALKINDWKEEEKDGK